MTEVQLERGARGDEEDTTCKSTVWNGIFRFFLYVPRCFKMARKLSFVFYDCKVVKQGGKMKLLNVILVFFVGLLLAILKI